MLGPPESLETDLVILGGGFMGLALARQASIEGLRSIIIEPNQVQTAHYMSGLLAPRADYLRLDKDEVELTAYECQRWQQMFPNIIKPKLFIMPLNDSSPYPYDFLQPLMEFYDKITSARLGNFYAPHFRINNTVLEQMEPNLRKSYFNEALGFYELTAEPNELLSKLRTEIMFGNYLNRIAYPDRVEYDRRENQIVSIKLAFSDIRKSYLIKNDKGLVVVNCAGPWMQNAASLVGLDLPVDYQLGFQLAIQDKYLFQHSIITFGPDSRYLIASQRKDYVQIGPTNTLAQSPKDIDSQLLKQVAIDYLGGVLKTIIEPGYNLGGLRIRSGGLRVRLKLPLAPDSHRPFILNIGFENYYVIYPGKAVLAFRTADEFIDNLLRKKRFTFCLDGRYGLKNSAKLNLARIKSLAQLAFQYCRAYLSNLFKN